MQNHTSVNSQINSNDNLMEARNPANKIARIQMQIMALFKYKPIKANLNRPIISFSFDDVPKSAIDIGAKILEKHDLKGTFYVTGGHCDKTFENVEQYNANGLKSLYENGHEIACHTFSHPRLRGRTIEQIEADLNKNLHFFQEILENKNFKLNNHAFPYGEFDETTLKVLAQRFNSVRGVLSGVNHGNIDFANLRTISIEKQKFSIENIENSLKKAKATNGWILFFTHDIDDNCTPYGSTPEMLETTIKMAKDSGIEIMTVNEAAKAIMNA